MSVALARGPEVETDLAEFERMFHSVSQRTVGAVALVTGSVVAAEEATQEAFVRALLRWSSVREHPRPDLWVLRTATRIAIDDWRKRKRETPLEGASHLELEGQIESLWLNWGLAQLTPKQRQAVVLKYFAGMTTPEIAHATDRSTETVKSHLESAMRRLRRLFTGQQ